MDHLYNFCFFLLAQSQTVPAEGAGKEVADAAAEAGQGGLFGLGYFLPAILAVMVLYMLMSAKPQGQSAASKSELLANLKKNDQVVTAGGILGTVVNYRSDAEYVTLRVDDSSGSRMQVLASSIVRVVSDDDKKQD